MLYSVVRDRKWLIELTPKCKGWYYRATVAPGGTDVYWHPPVTGWSLGSVRDGMDAAIERIDMVQGRPTHCELPRKVKEVARG